MKQYKKCISCNKCYDYTPKEIINPFVDNFACDVCENHTELIGVLDCSKCKKIISINFGNMDDLTQFDVDGYICHYCEQQTLFPQVEFSEDNFFVRSKEPIEEGIDL